MFCELPANTAVRYILTLLPQRNPLYDACVSTRTMLRQLNSDTYYEAEVYYWHEICWWADKIRWT